jgi:hypothetical protein
VATLRARAAALRSASHGGYSVDVGLAQQHRRNFVLPVAGGVNVQAPIEGVPIAAP